MKMTFTMPVEIQVEITGDYTPSRLGTHEYPDEASELDVHKAFILIPIGKGEYKRIDCDYDLLDEDVMIQKADDAYYS